VAVALVGLVWLGAAADASAQPPAPQKFCEVYPDAPTCSTGITQCTTCHTIPPARNLYGQSVSAALLPDEPRPLTPETFVSGLPDALAAVEGDDADGDGYTNLTEILAGSSPAEPADVPGDDALSCDAKGFRPTGLDVCAYDPVYVYEKIKLDFCGVAPTYDEMQEFEKSGSADDLSDVLDDCLTSEYWIGKDGVLWNMANSKIKPIQAIKSGDDAGPIPLADYEDDYNFFVYATSGDRDARDLLTGDYFVERTDDPTVYKPFQRNPAQDVSERGYYVAQGVIRQRRAGMITHRWFLMSNTMFTGVPRTTAAQAYRAYLGYDIAKLQGIYSVPGEPKDYDNKGVTRPACAQCHATLDPLTYPFSRYEGIGGGMGSPGDDYIPFTYNANRIGRFTSVDGDSVADTPEAGYIFGQKVDNLIEWSEVAANSDAFARALVGDFWKLLLGEEPRPSDTEEFDALWKRFMNEDGYNVEAMLHDLVKTEAYGVP